MNERQLIADLLSALEYHTEQTRPIEFSRVAIEAAREYLRKPAQPSKPWVGLTDEDIERLSVESGKATFLNDDEQTDILWFDGDCMSLARAIEAKLREKNA